MSHWTSSPENPNEYVYLNEPSDPWVRSYIKARGFGHVSAEKRTEFVEEARKIRVVKRVQTFQHFLRGVDLDIGTSGKMCCHYLVFQPPAKTLRAHGLKFGRKVRGTLKRITGQRRPFLFADLARDEDQAREIGLRLEGTTEVDVSPRGT